MVLAGYVADSTCGESGDGVTFPPSVQAKGTRTPTQPTAVRHHESSEVPLSPQQVPQELPVGARRHSVDGIVAAHVGHGASRPTRLEGRLEGFDPVSVAHHSVEAEAAHGNVLWACVHIEVLAGGLRGESSPVGAHRSSWSLSVHTTIYIHAQFVYCPPGCERAQVIVASAYDGLDVLGVWAILQSLHILSANLGLKERVFPIPLLAAAPAC